MGSCYHCIFYSGGHCKRYPPIITKNGEAFPFMDDNMASQGCGEFKKEDKKDG